MLDADLPLSELLAWYFRVNPRIRSRLTHEQYVFALRDFGEALRRPPVVADLTEEALADMRSLLLSRQLSAKTINERIGRITALWRFLATRGMVQRHPPAHRLTEPRRIPQAWSLDEMARVLAAVSSASGSLDSIPERLWWRSLMLAMWDSAERITALLSAEWRNYDQSTGWLLIPAENRKAACQDAIYQFDDPTQAAISAISQPSRNKIWPWPRDRSYLWIRYRTLLKRAGLPTDRYSGFHKIRRTVASHYDAAGGNASQLLGHTDRRVTERSYLDPRISPRPQARDKLPRLA